MILLQLNCQLNNYSKCMFFSVRMIIMLDSLAFHCTFIVGYIRETMLLESTPSLALDPFLPSLVCGTFVPQLILLVGRKSVQQTFNTLYILLSVYQLISLLKCLFEKNYPRKCWSRSRCGISSGRVCGKTE